MEDKSKVEELGMHPEHTEDKSKGKAGKEDTRKVSKDTSRQGFRVVMQEVRDIASHLTSACNLVSMRQDT